VCFVPWLGDPHPDHSAAGEVALAVAPITGVLTRAPVNAVTGSWRSTRCRPPPSGATRSAY
jgi:LmbE family N-acetylglucosaminyl deacetylase